MCRSTSFSSWMDLQQLRPWSSPFLGLSNLIIRPRFKIIKMAAKMTAKPQARILASWWMNCFLQTTRRAVSSQTTRQWPTWPTLLRRIGTASRYQTSRTTKTGSRRLTLTMSLKTNIFKTWVHLKKKSWKKKSKRTWGPWWFNIPRRVLTASTSTWRSPTPTLRMMTTATASQKIRRSRRGQIQRIIHRWRPKSSGLRSWWVECRTSITRPSIQ